MIFQENKTIQILAIFALSVVTSFIVLNRWLVVDIGVRSYGRVWQLYISYEDFGFVRRALIGTIFSITELNTILENEYHFSILIHHFSILILAIIILIYVINNQINDISLIATVFLSPALIIQSGYTTGSLDIFVLILLTLNVLHVKNTILFTLILILGVLTHELFIFTIPAQILSRYLSLKLRKEGNIRRKMIGPITVAALSIIVVSIFGVTNFPQSYVETTMAEKLPNAAWQHSLWSGYYEISKSAIENTAWSGNTLLKETQYGAIFLIVPALYLFFVTVRLLSCAKGKIEKLVLLFSTLCPLLVSFFAADLYRWIGMSANVGLLLTLSNLERGQKSETKITFVLLPFSFLGPFGAAQIDRPFPAQQFILESFFG